MKRLLAPFFILILGTVFAFLWFKEGSLPVEKDNHSPVIFVISPGSSVNQIARNLEKEKLIRSPLVFYLLVKTHGLEKKIQYGDFRLSPSMNALEIAKELTHGTLDAWVTIIEGLRVEEIASIVAKELSIPETIFINKAKAKEGYLFPDTYLVPKGASCEQIITILENNFKAKVGKTARQAILSQGLTFSEGIILASLLEREAQNFEDKRMIAGILLNRLNIDMALQVDATVQYALGYSSKEQTWWPKNLTSANLKVDSPYNTYLYPGLPPSPIANPGLESILAVGSLKPNKYFYYLTDKNGVMHYAVSLKEHNQNIDKYLN